MKAIATIVSATLISSVVYAQQVSGSITQDVEMKDSTIISGEVSARTLKAGTSDEVTVQSIVVGDRARVSGSIYQKARLNNSTLFVGSGSTSQSIKVGR